MFNKLIAWVIIFEALVAFLTVLSFGLGRADRANTPPSQVHQVALRAAITNPQAPH